MGVLGLLAGGSSMSCSAAMLRNTQLPPRYPACPLLSYRTARAQLLLPLKASLRPSSNLHAKPGFLKPCLSLHIPVAMQLAPLSLQHVGHDLLCTFVVFVSSLAWVRLFDLLVKKNLLDRKLSRKLVHILTGILYSLVWPLFSSSPWSRYFALAIPFANGMKLLVYGLGIVKDKPVSNSLSRSGTPRELLGGPLYYVMVLTVCTAFFWRDSPVGIVALAIMCGGDGVADIVGRRYGSIKLPYNPRKSWAGSVSMFVCSFILSVSLLYYYSSLGFFHLEWWTALRVVAWICAAGTVVESFPIATHLDDNISVPLVSLLLGTLLFPGAVL